MNFSYVLRSYLGDAENQDSSFGRSWINNSWSRCYVVLMEDGSKFQSHLHPKLRRRAYSTPSTCRKSMFTPFFRPRSSDHQRTCSSYCWLEPVPNRIQDQRFGYTQCVVNQLGRMQRQYYVRAAKTRSTWRDVQALTPTGTGRQFTVLCAVHQKYPNWLYALPKHHFQRPPIRRETLTI